MVVAGTEIAAHAGVSATHKTFVSQNFPLGGLSSICLLFWLATSVWLTASLYSNLAVDFAMLFLICLLAGCLFFFYFFSPIQRVTRWLIDHNFLTDKYDYRRLWTTFPERIGGSLDLEVIFQKLCAFTADAMLVQQVAIWLPSNGSREMFELAYRSEKPAADEGPPAAIHLDAASLSRSLSEAAGGSTVVRRDDSLLAFESMARLGIDYVVAVRSNGALLALLGAGKKRGGKRFGVEDHHLLVSIADRLANLIVTSRLSTELLEAREWASFNRVSSFLIHDLKNLATQQSMVLQNTRELGGNPEFIRDAFSAFTQTTEKMIHLIANLSVQKNQLATRHESVNLVDLLKSTFDDLRLQQRRGVQLILEVPRKNAESMVWGDPELLQKAFTNILLNAVQSLPQGEGTIQVSIQKPNGKVITAVSDTGQGIGPDTLKNLFRPFKTTKQGGTGIGLCHTRTIVESHGGRIRVESQPRKGTRVEIELPAN